MRTVVFAGNCQARVYYNLYVEQIAPRTGEQVFYVASFAHPTEANRSLLSGADVVAAQLFDVDARLDIDHLTDAAKIIWFPNVSGMFLWPFGGQAHPRNRPEPFLPHGPYDLNMGDRWLNRFVRRGDVTDQEAAQIADEYVSMDLASAAKADRYYELTMGQQKQRDARTGFDCGSVIERHLHDTPLFSTAASFSMPLFSHVIMELFMRLGASRTRVEEVLRNLVRSPFPAIERPLHPSIVKFFDLRHVQPGRRYRGHAHELLTLRAFAIQYLKYDWNAPLLEAIHNANRLPQNASRAEVDAAAKDLELHVARSAGSPESERALSRLYERQGDLPKALAACAVAQTLDPENAHAIGHFSHLLVGSGRLGEAIQQLTIAVDRWPQIADHSRNLAGLLWRSGQLGEALKVMSAASERHPGDPHVRKFYENLKGHCSPEFGGSVPASAVNRPLQAWAEQPMNNAI